MNFNFIDFGARLFNPALAVWTTADPMNQYASPYVYCGDDPMNRIDPTGMWDEPNSDWDEDRYNRRNGRLPHFEGGSNIVWTSHGYMSQGMADRYFSQRASFDALSFGVVMQGTEGKAWVEWSDITNIPIEILNPNITMETLTTMLTTILFVLENPTYEAGGFQATYNDITTTHVVLGTQATEFINNGVKEVKASTNVDAEIERLYKKTNKGDIFGMTCVDLMWHVHSMKAIGLDGDLIDLTKKYTYALTASYSDFLSNYNANKMSSSEGKYYRGLIIDYLFVPAANTMYGFRVSSWIDDMHGGKPVFYEYWSRPLNFFLPLRYP